MTVQRKITVPRLVFLTIPTYVAFYAIPVQTTIELTATKRLSPNSNRNNVSQEMIYCESNYDNDKKSSSLSTLNGAA